MKTYQHLNTFYAGPLRYGVYVSRGEKVVMICGEWYYNDNSYRNVSCKFKT